MDKKMIAKATKKIEVKERLSEKLIRFLLSERGQKVVPMIGYMPLYVLTRTFQMPSLARAGTSEKQMNVLMHAVAKAGLGNKLRHTKLIDYTDLARKEDAYDKQREKFVKNYQKNKPQAYLLPYEQYLINKKSDFEIKRRENGSYVIKTEIDNDPNNVSGHKLLFDKQSGLPIFKWRKKPDPMGIAWKLHAYEVHKMAKYDKKMAIKEESDKKSDLFPDQITAKYKMLREAHLEQLRNDLVDLYCPRKIAVVIKNENTEEVKKIQTDNTIKLRHCITTRGLFVPDKVTIPVDVRQRLNSIADKIASENPNTHATCIHLTNKRGELKKLLMPITYSLTA